MRLLSHSEIQTALDCEYKHAFSYTGHLSGGTTLRSKNPPILLRQGRAWGIAVASYHSTGSTERAEQALAEALEEDAEEQSKAGVCSTEDHVELHAYLQSILDHYAATNEPLGIDRLEQEIIVPIPSRTGKGRSNLYRLQAFFDGMREDQHGPWLYEAKLRTRLSDARLIARSRQLRFYAWAFREKTGRAPVGIIHDETLNAVPSPVKFNKDGGLSKVQSCTVEQYREAGGTDDEVAAKLAQKKWGRQDRIFLTEAELDLAGQQLVAAAQRIRDLDAGMVVPIPNPSPARCPGCAFNDVCDDPQPDLLDMLFDRRTPKRLKEDR